MDRWMINISNLTNEEVDFYNYTLNNVDLLIYSTLNEVAKDYGCGISFIYKFFERIEVSGLKEYIYKISFQKGLESKKLFENSEENVQKTSNSNSTRLNKIASKMLADYNINNNLNFEMLQSQLENFVMLCESLKRKHKIYGFGLGHAELAIKELFGMFEKFGIKTDQHFKGENLDEFIDKMGEDDMFIVYSFKGIHDYTSSLIKKVINRKNSTYRVFVTANRKSKLVKNFDQIFYINNNIRNIDYLNRPLLLSVFNSFIFFNDFIKNVYYILNKTEIHLVNEFKQEMDSWRNI